jgi:SnoaL-like protein
MYMSAPITGQETDIDPTDPVGVLAEFYHAFNSRSFQLLELNWIDSEDASMESAIGGIERGWTTISKIYGLLLHSRRHITLELRDYSIHRLGETFLAVGSEHGRFTSENGDLDFVIHVSRWFTMVYGRWRQVHYHGSIDDAQVLARFQSLMGAANVSRR